MDIIGRQLVKADCSHKTGQEQPVWRMIVRRQNTDWYEEARYAS
jgi:hypothetical protein